MKISDVVRMPGEKPLTLEERIEQLEARVFAFEAMTLGAVSALSFANPALGEEIIDVAHTAIDRRAVVDSEEEPEK